jgi:hypothetical protein
MQELKEEKFALMVEGKQSPSKTHNSFDEAETEAIRLARQEKRDVYIFKLIAKAELADVKITIYL